jgi:hypothetical protein
MKKDYLNFSFYTEYMSIVHKYWEPVENVAKINLVKFNFVEKRWGGGSTGKRGVQTHVFKGNKLI